MEKKKTYKATGFVLGNYWGGGTGAYATIEFTADTKEELLEKANVALKDGSIDSGMGYESLIGAILDITVTTKVELEDENYFNEKFEFDTVGELTDEQYNFLQECCLWK
tara:strand:+ start:149 stop:475 length:327 start_codon:yes stop_codon:yes gene_type:complete